MKNKEKLTFEQQTNLESVAEFSPAKMLREFTKLLREKEITYYVYTKDKTCILELSPVQKISVKFEQDNYITIRDINNRLHYTVSFLAENLEHILHKLLRYKMISFSQFAILVLRGRKLTPKEIKRNAMIDRLDLKIGVLRKKI